MQRHKHPTQQVGLAMKKYPESSKQETFRTCNNLKCAHHDPYDPGGNNCTLLFALSEEGCKLYAQRLP